MSGARSLKARSPKIPTSIRVQLGRARRMYVRRLMARGLAGDTPAEVVDFVFCRGLQELVPAEWMRDAAAESLNER